MFYFRAWSHEPLASIASQKIGKKSLDATHDAIVDVGATLVAHATQCDAIDLGRRWQNFNSTTNLIKKLKFSFGSLRPTPFEPGRVDAMVPPHRRSWRR